jgi:hypothetical protein
LKDNLFQGKGEKSPGKTSLPSTLHNWATFEIPEKVTFIASGSSFLHFNVVMQMKLDFIVGYINCKHAEICILPKLRISGA